MTTIKSIRLMGGYMDTRINGEDFAITPYMSFVNSEHITMYGIGLCWGFWAVCLGIGINVPKGIKSFVIYRK